MELDQFNYKFQNTLPSLDGIASSDIYFEEFSINGLDEMHRYSKDARLYDFLEFEAFEALADTKKYIHKLLERMLDNCHMYWFVRRKSDKRLIGTAALVNLDYPRKSIELGYGVDPELWGLGYVIQIQEALKYFVFEILKLNRMHGITMVGNNRVIQSVLASNMKHEGISRQYYRKNGVFYDGWEYSIISDDYFAAKDSYHQVSSQRAEYNVEEVIDIISSILIEDDINLGTSMSNTFSWDSLNHMSIITELSKKFNIRIPPIKAYHATSVNRIMKMIQEL